MKQLPKRKKVKTESPIEDIVLREFHLLDIYPVPQFQVGKYRVDLAFPREMIAIECDGREWHSSEEQIKRDKEKDKFLEENGWRVIRISGSDIFRKAEELVGIITGTKKERINNFQKFTSPDIEIDYEMANLDEIEDLEEKKRFLEIDCEGNPDFQQEEFLSAGNIIAKRYKFGIRGH